MNRSGPRHHPSPRPWLPALTALDWHPAPLLPRSRARQQPGTAGVRAPLVALDDERPTAQRQEA